MRVVYVSVCVCVCVCACVTPSLKALLESQSSLPERTVIFENHAACDNDAVCQGLLLDCGAHTPSHLFSDIVDVVPEKVLASLQELQVLGRGESRSEGVCI